MLYVALMQHIVRSCEAGACLSHLLNFWIVVARRQPRNSVGGTYSLSNTLD
jgi:hypothetical protein